MSLVALVTDTHCGVRGDNQHFAAYQRKFFKEIFYPKIDELGIKTVIHLGDIVDRRKYIEFLTAKNLREDVIEPAKERDLDFHVIIGNHDTRFKGTNEVNVMDLMFRDYHYPKLKWYSEPDTINVDGLDIVMMPWINTGNINTSFEYIQNSDAPVLMGHLEIAGFEMHKGQVSEHGFDLKKFDKFDQVMSGHFHIRSRNRNVTYLGAPFEMTWSDYGDQKGFHIFDTETRDLEFIPNPLRMFHKVFYNDLDKTMDEALDIPEGLEGTFVKVIVKNKTNPYWFDIFIDRLEKTGVLNVQVVEDNLNLPLEDDHEILDQAEDTFSIMKKYISSVDTSNIDKSSLERIIHELYLEALSVE